MAPYSLRAGSRPTVALPVTRDEVEAAVAAGDPARLVFGPGDALRRVEAHGDLAAPLLGPGHELSAARLAGQRGP